MEHLISRVGRGIAACLLVAMGVACAAAPSEAAPAVPGAGYGFSLYGGNIRLSRADLDRELDAVSRTSATWLRVIFDSFRIETTRGVFDWSYTDQLVDAAKRHGLNLLVTLSYSPEWARPPDSTWNTPPTDAQDFADFAGAVVSHYRDRVSSWQIWNEPNSQGYFKYGGEVARRYTELLKAAYGAIKGVQPASTVVTAGLSRMGEISPPDFVAQLYANGAQGYFDAVGMHPYVSPQGLAVDPFDGWANVGRVHSIMDSNGDGGKQIWLTELGAPTIADGRGVSEEEQANQITDVLGAAARSQYIGPAFIFTVRDEPGHAADPEYTYGALLTADWRPKFAAEVLAGYKPAG
jgi:hypothetical protein